MRCSSSKLSTAALWGLAALLFPATGSAQQPTQLPGIYVQSATISAQPVAAPPPAGTPGDGRRHTARSGGLGGDRRHQPGPAAPADRDRARCAAQPSRRFRGPAGHAWEPHRGPHPRRGEPPHSGGDRRGGGELGHRRLFRFLQLECRRYRAHRGAARASERPLRQLGDRRRHQHHHQVGARPAGLEPQGGGWHAAHRIAHRAALGRQPGGVGVAWWCTASTPQASTPRRWGARTTPPASAASRRAAALRSHPTSRSKASCASTTPTPSTTAASPSSTRASSRRPTRRSTAMRG